MVSLAAGGIFEQVTLHFTSAYAEDTAQLQKGKWFTARCTEIIEVMGFPQLRGCTPLSSQERANTAQNNAMPDEVDYLTQAADFIAAHNNDPCGGYGEALNCDPNTDRTRATRQSDRNPSAYQQNQQVTEAPNTGPCSPDYLDADGYYRPPFGGVFFNQGNGCLRAPTINDLKQEVENLRAQGLIVTEH